MTHRTIHFVFLAAGLLLDSGCDDSSTDARLPMDPGPGDAIPDVGQGLQSATWETLPELLIPVRAAAVAEVERRIYVVGGVQRDGASTSALQIFDVDANSWSLGPEAPIAVDSHTAGVVDGQIHIISGTQALVGVTDQHWVFDPLTESWSQLAPIPVATSRATAQVLDGRIYVFGGVVDQDIRDNTQIYDVSTDTWTQGERLPVGTVSAVGGVLEGRIHLVGGGIPNFETTNEHRVYDPTTDSMRTHASYPLMREAGGGGVVGGFFCVFGGRLAIAGRHNIPDDNAFCFDRRLAFNWVRVPKLPTPRAEIAYLTVGDAIYAIGGDGAANAPVAAFERLVFRP